MAQITKDEWQIVRSSLREGEVVEVVVVQHEVYGFFVAINQLTEQGINLSGIVQIPDVSDTEIAPKYPAVGDIINAVILAFRDSDQRIWLSTKQSVFDAAIPSMIEKDSND